jgi:heme-degrading monooxygenase HmoA
MQSKTPVFQLTTCWSSEADFKSFVGEKSFFKESLARMQNFSSKPISMRAVQLEEPFPKPDGNKCLEVFTTVMPPNLAQEFRSHLNSDLISNARKAQGFIRSSYGKSLQQQNDKFMVVTFILWESIQAHQQFASGQACTQFG